MTLAELDALVFDREPEPPRPTECIAPNCTHPILARDLCGGHYARARRGQSLDAPILRGVEARLMARVDKGDADACWLWQGSTRSEGRYGCISIKGRSHAVHIVAYELFVGPVPDGLEIDHTCFEKLCVNPAHLEAVTHSENVRRSRAHYRTIAMAA